MTIEFQLWGQLREAAGTSKVKIEVGEGTTLEITLQQLADAFPELKPRILNDDRSFRSSILVFENGQQLSPDSLQTLVVKDTSYTLMSPIAGG